MPAIGSIWILVGVRQHCCEEASLFSTRRLPDTLAWAPLHLDVHSENVLVTLQGSLLLIDWKYAADGDIVLKSALLIQQNGLEGNSRQRFLQAYQQRRPGFSLNALRRSVRQWLP
ncbi:MAG: phosphotransferase [Candidatus Malihini olakiniferum]